MRFLNSNNRNTTALIGLLLLGSNTAFAQAPTPKAPSVTLSGSLRIREEVWNWFKPTGNYDNSYAFTGTILPLPANITLPQATEGKLEIAAPGLFGLPKNAVAPAPQGALGLGGQYRAVNGSQNGSVFIKQGYLQKLFPGVGSIRLGRFEFSDGGETGPKDAALAYIKRERVAQRLVGPFTYTHVGRSIDGLQYGRTTPNLVLTGFAGWATQGAFDLDGASTITSVRLAYLNGTLSHYKSKTVQGEERFFLLFSEDARDITKTDNATTVRKDREPIKLLTIGGNVLRSGQIGAGNWDALLWGAFQTGDWGKLNNSSYAYDAEAGYRFGKTASAPWLRGGYYYGSGDGNPNDDKHQTFYAPLSTPRIYARTPFYTESNLKDIFVQAIFRPTPKWTIRTDYHELGLANKQDLWYAADGPYQTRPNFGLVGRRNVSGGQSLANLLDISGDFAATKNDTITLYLGDMMGKSVVKAIYPSGANGSYGYLEILHRF